MVNGGVCIQKQDQEAQNSHPKALRSLESEDNLMMLAMENQVKERVNAAEQAFERRLGIMEVKLSQDLVKERALREAAENELKEEKELREKQMATAAEEKGAAISAAVKELEQQLEKEIKLNTSLNKQIESMKAAWEAEKQAIEAEADLEVVSARTEADTLLTTERATVQRLRGEAAVLRQKYEDQLHTAKFAEANAQKSSAESKKLRIEMEGLVKDLAGVKSELVARESALQEKENTVREMTDRDRALEIKCAALTQARDAADKEAAEKAGNASNLAQQVESLRTEYRSAQKAVKSAELDAYSRQQRELAARKETAAQKQIADRLRQKLKAISSSIAEAGGKIQHPAELKNAVVDLYQTYAADYQFENQENRSGEEEFEKREHHEVVVEGLKATIQRLQRQLQDQRETNLAESRRFVSENAFLMKEIETLEQNLEKNINS